MGAGFFSGLGATVDTRIKDNIAWTRANYTDKKDSVAKIGAAVSSNFNKELEDLTTILNQASTLNIPKSALQGAYADGNIPGLKMFVKTIASRDDLRPSDHRQIYKVASAYADGADVDFNDALKRAYGVIPSGADVSKYKSSWIAALTGLGREGEAPITGPFGLSEAETTSAYSRIGGGAFKETDTMLDNIKFPTVRLDSVELKNAATVIRSDASGTKDDIVNDLQNLPQLSNATNRANQNNIITEITNLDIRTPLGFEKFAQRIEEINKNIHGNNSIYDDSGIPRADQVDFNVNDFGREITSPYELLVSNYQSDERLIFDNVSYTDSFKENYREYLNSLPRFNSVAEAKAKISADKNFINNTYPIEQYIFVNEELVQAASLL